MLFFKDNFSFYCFLRVAKGGASDPHDFNVGGRLKLIIVYSSSAIIWGIINSTAMTQSFWQNFAILGGATFFIPSIYYEKHLLLKWVGSFLNVIGMEILDETNQLTACMKNYFVPCVLMQHHEQKIGPQWNIFFVQQDSSPNLELTVVCIKVRTASFSRFWKNHP